VLGGESGLQLQQDMDPQKRGNMVRRLPKAFRTKLYWQYKKQFGIPGSAFDSVLEAAADEDAKAAYKKRDGGDFERRIAAQADLSATMAKTVTQTVAWPSTSQTIKSFFTAGIGRAWRYYSDKRRKSQEKAKKDALKKLQSVEKKE
jgi:translocator assembly and maintenance protein 41